LGMLTSYRKETGMDRLVAMCGLICSDCPAYLATVNNDDEKRRETAAAWSKQFGVDIKPEGINCMGCLSTEGPVFHHCTVCEIRKCGMDKGVPDCGHCAEYACEKLTAFFEHAPAAKAALDEIRSGL